MQPSDFIYCSEIIYRALLKKSCVDIDTQEVSVDAYFLRPDEKGISVVLASKCPIEVLANSFKKCHGVASLHTGHLRDLELDVIPDPQPGIPAHALIVKVPNREEDRTKAERVAGLLARRSRLIWTP